MKRLTFVLSTFLPPHADKNLRQIFASHGIGGLVGNILTALFAQKSIAAYDGAVIRGGWLDCNYMQLAYHLANSSAGLSYSFVMTVSGGFFPEWSVSY